MPASLQQLLAQQPPSTSGVHEAVASHAEDIFKQFRGILPLFLGKRRTGPFINLTLPNAITESSEALLQSLSDLIWVYDLRLVSFVSAVRMRSPEDEEARLKALLITADNARAYFQIPWNLDFDADGDITSAERGASYGEIVPREIWGQIFAKKISDETRTLSYDRLCERFGGPEQIPEP